MKARFSQTSSSIWQFRLRPALALVLFVIALGVIWQNRFSLFPRAAPPPRWQSNFHSVSFIPTPPWQLITAPQDSPENLLLGFLDKTDGSSYVVKVTTDYPVDQVSEEELFEALKTRVLSEHDSNKLLQECDVTHNGVSFHRICFDLYNSKFSNRMHADYHVRRTGKWCLSIQWAFPHEGHVPEGHRIPEKIERLNSAVSVSVE